MDAQQIERATDTGLAARLDHLTRVLEQEDDRRLRAERQAIVQELDWRRVEDSYQAFIARQAAGGGLWS